MRKTDRQTNRQIGRQTSNRIPKLQTDTHFLELSETCLYMVILGLGSFSGNCKNSKNIGLMKSKPKKGYSGFYGTNGTHFIIRFISLYLTFDC